MHKDKMRVWLYLQKSGWDKSGQAPIMGRTTFLQRYDQVVEEEKKLVGVEISKRWHSVYYMIRKHLRAFVQGRYQTNDVTFGQLTEEFLEGLHQYSVGRHSFDTLTLEGGVPIESIATIMGHA